MSTQNCVDYGMGDGSARRWARRISQNTIYEILKEFFKIFSKLKKVDHSCK